MNEVLDGITSEKLWELFPIVLSKYRPEWKENYFTEKTKLEQAIGKHNIVRINHCGSTAIPGLIAKPTIDILIEIKNDTNTHQLRLNMQASGYIYNEQPRNLATHMMFMKGYTPQGFNGQVFHVHVRYNGDWDELYFRDYLLTHPEVADEYGKLKLKLQKIYQHDRNGYANAKDSFIRIITKLARTEMSVRY